MTAALFLRDPDSERRRRGVQAAAAALQRLGLRPSVEALGPITVVWAAYDGAPVSRAPGAFVMGELIPGPGPGRITAEDYAGQMVQREIPPAFDGFHLAAIYDLQGRLTVAVDILGMLAVFHATLGDVLMVATSPALITCHPDWARAIDPLGLAGLLVANASLRGRTPYRGIRRLAAGHALVAGAGTQPREVRQYGIELNTDSHDVSAEECALRVHEALVDATRRHAPAGGPHTMMLSGGLDSRVITGVLAGQGVAFNAITYGIPSDLEARCAHAVARRLRLEHHLVPEAEATLQDFETTLWWDGLTCAPGGGTRSVMLERLPHAHSWRVAGYMADPILGGITVGRSFDRTSRTASSEHSVRRLNRWGVPLDVLPRLLRKEVFGDSVGTIVAEMREDYTASADTDLGRSWLFHSGIRGRFVQGRMWGQMAFSGWPRAPHVDRALLRVVAGVPLPVLADRRLEREMLERFHTALARLPLDRNDHDITPPLPGVMDLVRAGLDRRIRGLRKRIGFPRPDRRYYHRTYDFDGGGWRTFRRGAEGDRERAYTLFDRATYDSLVPPAGAPWRSTGSIEGPSAAKLLTAIAIWQRIALG